MDYQESSYSEDDDLPRISIPGLPPKSDPDAPQPSINDIYEMFRNMPKGIVDKVYAMSNKDSNAAYSSESILDTLRRDKLIGKRVKITVDEDDIFNDALVFYKSNDFDPTRPIVVKMENQPALDTGGIRRQFFTDVLEQFALNDSLSLFIGERSALRPHHSPQLLPLLRLLGTIVAHSLVHGGPGFPYLASYIYWYIVSGSEETALS